MPFITSTSQSSLETHGPELFKSTGALDGKRVLHDFQVGKMEACSRKQHCVVHIKAFSNGQTGEMRVNKAVCFCGGRHDMSQGRCEHRNEVQVTQHPRQAHLSLGHVHCSACIMAHYIPLRTEYYGGSIYTSLMHTALLYNKCSIVSPSIANAVALLVYLVFPVVICNSVQSFSVCLIHQNSQKYNQLLYGSQINFSPSISYFPCNCHRINTSSMATRMQ